MVSDPFPRTLLAFFGGLLAQLRKMTTQMVHLRDCASRPKFVYFFEALTAKGLSEPSIQRWFVQGRVRPPPSDPRGGGVWDSPRTGKEIFYDALRHRRFFLVYVFGRFFKTVCENATSPLLSLLCARFFFVQGEGGPTLSPLYLITC